MLCTACAGGRKLQRCTPGQEVECGCGDGGLSVQVCTEDATFGVCECALEVDRCALGDEVDCTCIDGSPGLQRCQRSGAYGGCECSPDAAMPDAAVAPGGCSRAGDSDGDGLEDCDELTDADPWTDAERFNGLAARLYPECGAAARTCAALADPALLNGCTGGAPLEILSQSGGWDFGPAAAGDACDDNYGFAPGWASCPRSFAILWEGFVNLSMGRHCFFVSDGLGGACGALQVATSQAEAFGGWDKVASQSVFALYSKPRDPDTGPRLGGGDLQCRFFEEGIYPLRMFVNTWDAEHGFRVRHCRSDSGSCAPGSALSVAMLRPSYP